MRRPDYRFAIIPFLITVFLGHGFPADAGFITRPISFQNLSTKEGLSSEMIFAIAVQGDEIWFGTYAGGTTLYDRSKKTFQVFTTKGEPPEKDDGVAIKWKNHPAYNDVTVILPDKDRLWFGTYFYGFGGGGISYYHPKRKNPWRSFNTNNGVAKKIVSLALDGDILWVGSERGISALDKRPKNGSLFIPPRTAFPGISSMPCWSRGISFGRGPMEE